jgi:general secretion pathway protein A
MYEKYWGLAQSPFSGGQTITHSSIHEEAAARLDFLAENRSRLGLVLGPSGSGKSLLLGQFVRRQRRSGAAAAFLSAHGTNYREFLLELASQWNTGASETSDNAWLWLRVSDRLANLGLERVPAILAVDDLDAAPPDLAGLVYRLASLSDVPLTIVASAQETSTKRLGSRLLNLAELRIDLPLWNEEETREYLRSTLAAAGRSQPAFEDRAVHRLFELSAGAPRKVNHLAQLALVAGAAQKLTQIDEQTVLAVHEELSATRS